MSRYLPFLLPTSGYRRARLLALLALANLIFLDVARAGVSNSESYATKYFLDEPPTAADLARLPRSAREVVIGKVRLLQAPISLVRRERQPPLPKYGWAVRLELITVIAGNAQPGDQATVSYGPLGRPAMSPVAPRMIEREYFVVSYFDDDEQRRLLGFPVSREEYDAWSDELGRQLRERDKARPRQEY